MQLIRLVFCKTIFAELAVLGNGSEKEKTWREISAHVVFWNSENRCRIKTLLFFALKSKF